MRQAGRAGDRHAQIPVISTPLVALDAGVGGCPRPQTRLSSPAGVAVSVTMQHLRILAWRTWSGDLSKPLGSHAARAINIAMLANRRLSDAAGYRARLT